MHSFFIKSGGAVGTVLTLPPAEAAHALKVLRLSAGDEVTVLDGAGSRWTAVIETAGGEAAVRLTEDLPGHEPPVRVTLYQGMPKADKLELVAQKGTELGLSGLVPVVMERSVAKGAEGGKRRERLERIVREASKQCRRGCVPGVADALAWPEARRRLAEHELVLVPWEGEEALSLADVFESFPRAKDIGIVIGPEGGMTASEVGALRAQGAQAVTLGPRILRTETAAIASVAVVMALWGDL